MLEADGVAIRFVGLYHAHRSASAMLCSAALMLSLLHHHCIITAAVLHQCCTNVTINASVLHQCCTDVIITALSLQQCCIITALLLSVHQCCIDAMGNRELVWIKSQSDAYRRNQLWCWSGSSPDKVCTLCASLTSSPSWACTTVC